MGAHTCHRHIWGETGTTATTVAESERLRGAVGTIREGGVPIAAHPVWGSVAPPCAEAIRGAFSSRAESSGQGQRTALSCGQPRHRASRPNSMGFCEFIIYCIFF